MGTDDGRLDDVWRTVFSLVIGYCSIKEKASRLLHLRREQQALPMYATRAPEPWKKTFPEGW